MTISISRTGGDAAPVRPVQGGDLLVPGAYLADRYRLVDRLLHRPYVQVWAVHDLFGDRDVELTVLVAEDELSRLGFADRVRALAAVREPAVVRVGEHGTGTVRVGGRTAPVMFVITEPAPGVPLTEVPTGDGQLAIARVLDLIGQAARGLDVVHRMGIVHGGIRRSSLFVARQHRMTIVDFPLCFDRGPRIHPVTDPGEGGIYLAPELWRPGQDPSPLGDVYALGVVAFECLAGRPPFDPDQAATLAAAPWGAQPPELPESLAADVRWVVATAMQPDPRRRFTSAGQFADALEDLTRLAGLDGEPTVTLRRPAVAPTPPPQEARTRDAFARESFARESFARESFDGNDFPRTGFDEDEFDEDEFGAHIVDPESAVATPVAEDHRAQPHDDDPETELRDGPAVEAPARDGSLFEAPPRAASLFEPPPRDGSLFEAPPRAASLFEPPPRTGSASGPGPGSRPGSRLEPLSRSGSLFELQPRNRPDAQPSSPVDQAEFMPWTGSELPRAGVAQPRPAGFRTSSSRTSSSRTSSSRPANPRVSHPRPTDLRPAAFGTAPPGAGTPDGHDRRFDDHPDHPDSSDGATLCSRHATGCSRHTAGGPFPWLACTARRALRRLEPRDVAGGALTVSAIGLVLALGTVAVHGATQPGQTVNRMVLHLVGGRGGQQAAAPGATADQTDPAAAELVQVPDVTGRPLAAVLPLLRDQLHLQVRLRWQPQQGGTSSATVVAQTPRGARVPHGSVVTLTVLATPSGDRSLATSSPTAAPAIAPTAVLAPAPLNVTHRPAPTATTPAATAKPGPTASAGKPTAAPVTPTPTPTPTAARPTATATATPSAPAAPAAPTAAPDA